MYPEMFLRDLISGHESHKSIIGRFRVEIRIPGIFHFSKFGFQAKFMFFMEKIQKDRNQFLYFLNFLLRSHLVLTTNFSLTREDNRD